MSSNIEDRIYQELCRDDEWAAADGVEALRSKLFGDDEWAYVREAEWKEEYNSRRWEDMGS
jgi:hypothetical protein